VVLREGRLEHTATPPHIRDEPVNENVARFVNKAQQ
jgi:glycine betaine/proline transport system ATP-binding protein